MEYNQYRRRSRKIKVGNIYIGGDAEIPVQSMTNVSSADFPALLAQMRQLRDIGCDIIRMTVPDRESARNISRLKEEGITVPIVADIHFNYRLAIESAAAGADKIRINPGNIGGEERVKAVVAACRNAGIPIRVGVNSGSLQREILEKYGSPTPEALAESALLHAALLEKYDFYDTVLAVKSSDVRTMIQAVRILAGKCDYPLHLGVTEAGTYKPGVLRSAVGIGSLLCDGIGDTIRVSLTADPVNEVREGKALISSLGLARGAVRVVSCPTCGRTKIDLIKIASEVEERLSSVRADRPITVAVMGCAVNGPGEAREADIGIAGGDGEALLFRHGVVIGKLPEEGLADRLFEEVLKIVRD